MGYSISVMTLSVDKNWSQICFIWSIHQILLLTSVKPIFITLKLRIIFNVYVRSESLQLIRTSLYTFLFFESNIITILNKLKSIKKNYFVCKHVV